MSPSFEEKSGRVSYVKVIQLVEMNLTEEVCSPVWLAFGQMG